MGRYLTPGHEYEDGDTISGASMTEHVSEAILKPTAISEQILKDPATLTDELLINDNGTFKKVTVAQLKAIILTGSSLVPPGTIVDFAGTEAPEGWLLCYGQELLRETYDILFGVIGVTYGAGNGTTTFSLPDLRGVVVAGRDDMGGTATGWITTSMAGTTMGAFGGWENHTLTTAQMPSHSHSHTHRLFMYPNASESGSTLGLSSASTNGFQGRAFVTAGTAATVTNNDATAAGGGAVHNNMQPTIILNKIIRYL